MEFAQVKSFKDLLQIEAAMRMVNIAKDNKDSKEGEM